MRLNKLFGLALMAMAFALPPSEAVAKTLKVLTTTTDLAAIAKAVGGDKVEIQTLAKPSADIHFFEPRPSDVMKIRKADVFVKMGLELDTIWAQPLLEAARNNRLVQVDCSVGVPVLDKPSEAVNPSMGDVHALGNPHYQLDPENGKLIAQSLAGAFSHADPAEAAFFEQNKQAFDKELGKRLKGWDAKMAQARGSKVIDYHKEFTYFANRFGLKIVGTIEPKPGVPPTPLHTQDLVRLAKEQHVKAIVVEQWYNLSVPQLIQRQTGVPFVVIPTSVGGEPGVETYFDLFDRLISKLEPVLK